MFINLVKNTLKKLLFILMLLPVFTFGQKIYNVTGISVVHNLQPSSKIMKASFQIVIDDTSFSEITNGKKTVFKITKRINENYFKISDGLQEAIVLVTEQKTKKYTGFITQQMDDKGLTIISYYQ